MPGMKRPAVRCLFGVLLGLAVLGSGCSSYRRDLKAAHAGSSSRPGIEGVWEGTWHDEKRPAHGGEIRCVLTRTGANLYRMSTRSTWWKWFRSTLDTTVVVTPIGPDRFQLHGEREVWPFGDYSVSGRCDPAKFEGTYQAVGHRGVIELHRSAP